MHKSHRVHGVFTLGPILLDLESRAANWSTWLPKRSLVLRYGATICPQAILQERRACPALDFSNTLSSLRTPARPFFAPPISSAIDLVRLLYSLLTTATHDSGARSRLEHPRLPLFPNPTRLLSPHPISSALPILSGFYPISIQQPTTLWAKRKERHCSVILSSAMATFLIFLPYIAALSIGYRVKVCLELGRGEREKANAEIPRMDGRVFKRR